MKLESRNHRAFRSPFGSSGIPRNRKQPELSIEELFSPGGLERSRYCPFRRAHSFYTMSCIVSWLRFDYSEGVEDFISDK